MPFLPIILFITLATFVVLCRRSRPPVDPAPDRFDDLNARVGTLEAILTDRDRHLRDEINRLG